MEARAGGNVVIHAIETELAEVAGGDGNGRAIHIHAAFAVIHQYEIRLGGMRTRRIEKGVPNQHIITIGRTLTIINLAAAIKFPFLIRVAIYIHMQDIAIDNNLVADGKFKGDVFRFLTGDDLFWREQRAK